MEISTLAPSVQSHFRVEVRDEGQMSVIAVSGELDLASSSALEEELARVIDSASDLVVVDLRKLEFIDSTGFAHWSGHTSEQRRLENDSAWSRGPQQVQRLLSLTGVEERLMFADSAEELRSGG